MFLSSLNLTVFGSVCCCVEFKDTCGMCPVEVGAPVDSRARLQCRPGPSCLPSGPPKPQLCNTHIQANYLNIWIHSSAFLRQFEFCCAEFVFY